MEATARYHLKPQTGVAFKLEKGRILRATDPQGEQVSDVMAFASAEPGGRLRMALIGQDHRLQQHDLPDDWPRPLLEPQQPDVHDPGRHGGRHDFLLTPCSPEACEMLYEGHEGYHPSWLENLTENLNRFGIKKDDIPTTFNVFMNVEVLPSGEIESGPPLSKPGDFVDLRAETDLVVGVTACSAENFNNHTLKQIDLMVYG